MDSNSNAVIFGAGGHAKVVADIIIKSQKYNIWAFIDDAKSGQTIWNIPIISEESFFKTGNPLTGVVAIGDNFIREKVTTKIKSKFPDFNFLTAIHPSAQIGHGTNIDIGSVVMANVAINPSTKIGKHCIINTNSSIDHDCIISDFTSIAPNCCLGGNCEIGKSSAISIGATLIHKTLIGDHSIVGAGALVTKSFGSNIIAYGVPAKVIRTRKSGDKYL